MATSLVADISAYQRDDLAFFQKLKEQGVKAVIIKLTEGTGYVNAKAANQIRNAAAVGLVIHCYHYYKGTGYNIAIAQADYFCRIAKSYGIDATSFMCIDIEDSTNASVVNSDITWFLQRCQANGYPLVSWYSMASWWWAGRINPSLIPVQGAQWVAKYSGTNPGVDNTSLWQFSSTWPILGAGIDMSYDFYGDFVENTEPEKPKAPLGHLDGLRFDGDNLVVSGWFANTNNKPYSYVILTTEDGEVARQKVDLIDRPDVHDAYNDYDSKCGFEAEFKYTDKLAGKAVKIYFRHTDDKEGNGNYDDFVSEHSFDQQAGYLDSTNCSAYTNKLTFAGWFANDKSLGKKYQYLILLNGDKEVQRVNITSTDRDDVEKVNPALYNAKKSGFVAEFDYPDELVGKPLRLVGRYSDDKDGEGNYADYWFGELTGPAKPKLDGKTVNEIIASEATVVTTADGKIKLTFK